MSSTVFAHPPPLSLSLPKPNSSTTTTVSFPKTLSFPLQPPLHHPFSSSFHKTLNPKPPNNPLSIRTIPSSSAVDFSASSPLSPSLKSRLRNGDTLYGIFICSFSPMLAEIAGLAGYDFAVVDMEHGPGGIPDALHCLRALSATGTPAILRLPERSAVWAKKAMDLGPQGIMFPMIEGQEGAEEAVRYCRYPPCGVRGAAHPIVRASGYGIDPGYLGAVEEEVLVMCQVESVVGVERIEEIAAVEGVDCVQMGPLDLSASMGYLWDPGSRKVREMMRRAEEGVLNVRGSGKEGGEVFLAGFAMPFDTPVDLKKRGYQMVSGAVDVGLFRAAAVEDVMRFKRSLAEESSDNDKGRGEKDDDEKYWSE